MPPGNGRRARSDQRSRRELGELARIQPAVPALASSGDTLKRSCPASRSNDPPGSEEASGTREWPVRRRDSKRKLPIEWGAKGAEAKQ